MPRYRDDWIIDRVMFDYVSGGSCNCCGIQYNRFLFHTTPDLIATVSDLDTDQMTTEIASLNTHPWPVELRDQVWSDRVKIRQKCKLSMKTYRAFWTQYGEQLREWLLCRSDEEKNSFATIDRLRTLQRSLQMSRSELVQIIQEQYQIHSAYSLVLTAVLEQVAQFPMTAYPSDSCDPVEAAFEAHLQFQRMQGGFTLPIVETAKDDTDAATVRWDIVEILLNRMQSLGGPKLLHRNAKEAPGVNGDEEDGCPDDEDDADGPSQAQARDVSNGPSFQSDRRLMRWILARYWADRVIDQFHAAHPMESTEAAAPDATILVE
jgi:hypothetical protein